MADETEAEKKYAAMLEKRAEREAAKDAARKGADVEEFELEERFELELGGKRGVDFEIIDLFEIGEGFIVVKRGAPVLYRKMKESKIKQRDVEDFVTPQIAHPEVSAFKQICGRRDAIWTRCFDALAKLHGLKGQANAEKA